MKKIIAIMVGLMLIFAMPVLCFAEEAEAGEAADTTVTEDNSTTETETPTEEEKTPSEDAPAVEDQLKTITDAIAKFLEENGIDIAQIVTFITGALAVVMKIRESIKAAKVLNNNSITISKENATFMAQAQSALEGVSAIVTKYEGDINKLLEAFKVTAEEKVVLEREIVEINAQFKVLAEANIEFSNELAELLSLANIPNFKKEEIGARHAAAVNIIKDSEDKIAALTPAKTEEVLENGGEEK